MRKLVRLGFACCIAALPALNASPAPAHPSHVNGQIVFARNFIAYTVNPDGSREQQLSSEVAEHPRWSPDGSEVSILSDFCQFGKVCAALIVNPDTGTTREVPDPEPGTLALLCGWAWSPDGSRLACSSFAEDIEGDPSRDGIYTIRSSDGGDLRRVTTFGALPGDYSPNGKRLAIFPLDQNGDPLGLFIVHSDGTHLRRIAPAGVTCCTVGWSPQGNDIVFSRHVTPDVHSSMWIVHANGTGLREVPAQPAYGCGGPNSDPNAGGCFDPSWSPDGTQIVFGNGSEDLGRNVYTVRPDGTGLVQVTHGDTSQSNEAPDWGTHPLTP
jgi:Tol biopolymer transport system component